MKVKTLYGFPTKQGYIRADKVVEIPKQDVIDAGALDLVEIIEDEILAEPEIKTEAVEHPTKDRAIKKRSTK